MSSRTELTFCRICEATCGLRVTIEDDQLVAIEPDPDHVVSKGYSCIKGLRYDEIHHSPDRLRVPLKRVGDRFEEISWEQAFEEIGAKVRQLVKDHGGDSISGYLGNPIAFSLLPPVLFSAFSREIPIESTFRFRCSTGLDYYSSFYVLSYYSK